MTDEQLSNPIAISSGCDANGNAECFSLTGLCRIGDKIVNAGLDGVLDYGMPVLLFDQDIVDY